MKAELGNIETCISSFPENCTGSYRFGFNGQEMSNEISGTGNHNTAEFWEYDTRIGRRWNLDPKPNVSISSYAAFENNPIWFSDPYGDTVKYGGISEFLDVSFSRISSKAFRKEFNTLKNSTNTYKYNNTKSEGEEGGFINKISEGNFLINYSKRSLGTKNASGMGKFHALFEETYHASDFETGKSGLVVMDNNELGAPNLATYQISEAKAWIFAAKYSPFTYSMRTFTTDVYTSTEEKVRTYNPLTTQLKSLDENNIKDIATGARLLFKGFKVNVYRNEYNNQEGYINYGPIYKPK